MSWGKERIAQLQLPNPEDDDPHPRLLLEGDGVHAGQGYFLTEKVTKRSCPLAGAMVRWDW